MATRDFPKLFITLVLMSSLAFGISACTRTGGPTGGAGPTQQEEDMYGTNQTQETGTQQAQTTRTMQQQQSQNKGMKQQQSAMGTKQGQTQSAKKSGTTQQTQSSKER